MIMQMVCNQPHSSSGNMNARQFARRKRMPGTQRVSYAVSAVLLLSMLFTLSSCATMKTTLRYRLTVFVDTPQGVRSGFSVVEVTGYMSPAFPGPEAGGARFHARGEATGVKLADGEYLFAIFKDRSGYENTAPLLLNTFKDQLPPVRTKAGEGDISFMERFQALAKLRTARRVNPQDWPIVVSFSDVRNPYSAKIAIATELSAVLPRYSIREMTIEITDDPVTQGITKIIPWLGRDDIGYLDADVRKSLFATSPQYKRVDSDDFARGMGIFSLEKY